MRDENEIKQRLAKIEQEIMRCQSLEKIWQLKKEHQELSRLLNRIIRAAKKLY